MPGVDGATALNTVARRADQRLRRRIRRYRESGAIADARLVVQANMLVRRLAGLGSPALRSPRGWTEPELREAYGR